jgi:hypothetical protein
MVQIIKNADGTITRRNDFPMALGDATIKKENGKSTAIIRLEAMVKDVFDKIKREWDHGRAAPEDHWALLNNIEKSVKEHRDAIMKDYDDALEQCWALLEAERMEMSLRLKQQEHDRMDHDSMEDFYKGESA